MNKSIWLVILAGFVALLIGCHAGGSAPFINVPFESNLVSFEREVDENGRFADITFPSGAVIKCTQDGTLKEGTKIIATEQKVPNGTPAYIYNITAKLITNDALNTSVSVNTLEKPISVTLPNSSTTGTCYIGTRASESDPWRYSLATDGLADIRFVRLQASTPSQCNFNLYRLGISFALFVLNNQSKDETKIDSITVPTETKVTVMDGCYGEEIYIKVAVTGEKLANINPEGVIARITYRSDKETPDEIKANGSIVKQINLSDKAVSGGYEHSFEVTNLTIDSNAGEISLSFALNLNGLSLDVFPTDFLVEFYSKGDAADMLPFIYTLPFSFEKVEKQEGPDPDPLATYSITYDLDDGEPTGNNPSEYTVESEFTLSNPKKTGYTFLGWTGSNGNTPEETVTIAKGTSGNLSYKANWQQNAPGEYTLTLVAGTGIASVYDSKAYKADESITLNYTLKDGYEFDKWSDSNVNEVASPFIMPSEDVTLTANAKPISYSITYNLAEGSIAQGVINPTNYDVTSATITLKEPSKKGYEFIGWTGSNGDVPQKTLSIEKGSIGNRTYNANYGLISYDITYNLASGDLAEGVTNPATYDITSATIILENPTRKNYVFLGWTGTGIEEGTASKTVKIYQGTIGARSYVASWTLADVLEFTIPNSEEILIVKRPQPTDNFFMGIYEVTGLQYVAINGGNNPSHFSSVASGPVEKVSWNDASATCVLLTQLLKNNGSLPEGYEFVLPKEEQWEYTCRAGSTGNYCLNTSGEEVTVGSLRDYAWYYDSNSNTNSTHTVGKKYPNKWGFYDMFGNVAEWCDDIYSNSNRVMRGGNWGQNSSYCTSVYRTGFGPSVAEKFYGFRLALVKE
ncbi:MAG: SUMF1/EgtB/PvdO family nonheme iron enzyme [Candidatus Riflebacteria bacterium]|nr:SUMF1/EgtB/PvdO family nonheme iron enzyme [Candidatus Riflebacteria bacterium]